jgi:16S rRNA (cytosine967-C5)-methyltransferase
MAAKSPLASPARHEAFRILLEVEKGSAHSDELLRSARIDALTAQDRHLATTLVMGTLRWQMQLDAAIRPLLAKPNARLDAEIRIALRLGAFQLQHLDRIPAHAAIGESVALAKSAGHKFASGMVNAVLRKVAALPKTELSDATAYPTWMTERWAAHYGAEAAQLICHHGQRQAELILRIRDANVERELADQGIESAPGSLLTAARVVISGDITATEAFREGRVRIQDEGSQLVSELAGRGASILDACAAPGGKTLILAERNPQADVTAVEFSPTRFEALRQRLSVAASRIHVMQADATELAAEPTYDLALADVPCSGTGTLGRNPEIRHRLQPEDLTRQAERQRAILRAAMSATKVEGHVLYSTCSLEPEENAQVVAEILAQFPQWRQLSLADRVRELAAEGRLTEDAVSPLLARVAADGSLTLLPGAEFHGDGFFVALLKKPE